MPKCALSVCLLCLCLAASADYCSRNDPRNGGVNELMLLYLDDGSSESSRYTLSDLLPHVAYLDRAQDGRPVDWFFDSFLIHMHGYRRPDGSAVMFAIPGTKRSDCERYLDLAFAPDRNLHALDEAVARVAQTLGPPPRPIPVMFIMPYLSEAAPDFGAVVPGGPSLDFRRAEDRVQAARWLVDEGKRRFAAAAFKHLSLWGYYWVREGISPADEQTVRAVAGVLHDQGLRFCWIPYSNAPGSDHWQQLGFDLATMQPNYAFVDYNVPGRREEQRLCDIGAKCRQYGLGIEIESWHGARTDPEERRLLTEYLNHGLASADGYQGTVHAYYMQELLVRDLCNSPLPANTELYEDLYLFSKGRYRGRDDAVSRGQPCRVFRAGRPMTTSSALTGEGPAPPGEAVQIGGSGGGVMVDFPTERRSGEVRLHVRPGPGRADAPFSARVAMYGSDGSERVIDTVTIRPPAAGEAAARWVTVRGPVQAGVALGVGLRAAPDASLEIDQLRVLPPLPPATALLPTADGVGAAAVLQDGHYASAAEDTGRMVVWPGGKGTLTLALPPDRQAGTLWLHAVRLPGGQWPAEAVLTCAGRRVSAQLTAPPEGWGAYLPVAVPPVIADQASLSLTGAIAGQPLALDEAEVELAANLALAKPCTVQPPLPKRAGSYPDDGRKLTDGQLAETFEDGRLAGWHACDPTITLDLGRIVPVECVRVHAWGGGAADTWFPVSTLVSVSSDGLQWQPAPQTTLPPPEPAAARTNARRWLDTPCQAGAVRYVRLAMAARSFLLLDELQVISAGVNVAGGAPYSIAVAGGAESPARLTDGIVSVTKYYPCRVLTLGPTSTVTVDLLQPREVSLAGAHLCGGGLWGVWYPQEVRIETSLDGSQWESAAVVTEHPVETTREGTVALMEGALSGSARFVRWRFKGHGGVTIDEVEVYGK